MSKVKLDRIEGASLRRTAEGFEAVRVAYVMGLTGDASGRLRQAVEAAGIPQIGQSHPTIENLSVWSINVEPDGPHAAQVKITYRPPVPGSSPGSPPRSCSTLGGRKNSGDRATSGGDSGGGGGKMEVGTVLVQEFTETDLAGQRITVAYTATGNPVDLQTQGVPVSVWRPRVTLKFIRKETSHPANLARQFVGTVNQTRIFDSEPQTWLCTAITGQSADGEQTFDVTYEFQYKAQGWQPQVSYLDPQTNRPPADLAQDIGFKEITIYKQTDFRELGLAL